MKGLDLFLSRLRPWRMALAAAVVVLVAIALAAMIVRERSLEPLVLRAMDRAPRIAAGVSLAHERLTISALKVQTASAPPSQLARDLEGFHAAIAQLETVDQRALFADLPRFSATLERLGAFRAGTEALAGAVGSGDEALPPGALDALLADLAQLREPLADLVDSAISLQRLEIIRRTREVRGADRIALAALSIASLAGACLVLLLLRAPTAMGTAQPAGPPAPAVDPLLVAQAGSDVVAALHRTVGRLGLLVAADGATAEPLRSSRESAEAALAAAELMAEAAVLLAGRRSAQSMPFDAERVLRDALAEGAHAPALVQAAAGTPRLWRGDPLRFAALARALAAAAATPGTRSLSVLLARDPGGLAVTFGDGLQGPFELLDPGDTVPGLGAAALMVRALGGQLLRVRPAAGRAERLRLVLPFVPVAEADAGGTQGGRALRVLAVDDVPANRRLLAALLERHGHRCETAADAEAALARLSAGGIDVVLLDVHMPGIDGEAAARLIRSLPSPAGRVPIVAVTAQVAAEERAALLATGIVDVIEKPITSAELLSALSRAVGRPVGAASSAAPLTDRVAVSVLHSTLSAEDFARFVSDRLEMAAKALAQVEAAMAEQDRARAEAALDRLRAAFEPFGASRLAEVVAGFRRGEADLVDLRRTVEETSRALARGSPTPART